MEQIILIGGGGHAESVADSIRREERYEIAGFIGRCNQKNKGTVGLPLIGTDDDLQKIHDRGICYAVVAIAYMGTGDVRERLYGKLKETGYQLPVIMDPSAVLSRDVQIEEGTYIGKRAVVNANANIGKLCIINTGAIVEHDNEIGDFSHVAVGAVLCGSVRIGKRCLIGAGATVIQGVSIGDGSVVGAGTTVRHDIESGQIYYGK